MHLLSAALFAISANLDNFTIGVAYGVKRVRIDNVSNLLIAGFSCLGTYLSMEAGQYLGSFISSRTANAIGCLILILIGLWFLLVFFYQEHKRTEPSTQSMTAVTAEGENGGDIERCQKITRQETATLSLVLAINNMGLGIGGSITGISPVLTSVCTFLFSFVLIAAGQSFGRTYLSAVFGRYANLVSGGIILALGIYEMFI